MNRFADVPVPQVQVKNVRRAMSLMAAAFFGHPEKELKLLGDVYSKKLSPNAAYNLYVYKKTGTVTGN